MPWYKNITDDINPENPFETIISKTNYTTTSDLKSVLCSWQGARVCAGAVIDTLTLDCHVSGTWRFNLYLVAGSWSSCAHTHITLPQLCKLIFGRVTFVARHTHQLPRNAKCILYLFLLHAAVQSVSLRPFQYRIIRFIEVSGPQNLCLELSNRPEIWKESQDHCCIAVERHIRL